VNAGQRCSQHPASHPYLRLITNCDPWEGAVDKVEKKIDFDNKKNIEIIRGVEEDIPLPDNEIDLIVSNK